MTATTDAAARALEDALGDEQFDYADEEGEQLVPPGTLDTADRMAWALIRATERVAEAHAVAERRKAELTARIDTWVEGETASDRRRVESLTEALTAYGRYIIPMSKKRSVTLPAGVTIALKAPSGGVVALDPEGFIEWAEANKVPGVVRYPVPTVPPPAVDKNGVAMLAKATDQRSAGEGKIQFDFVLEGEVVPGVAWEIADKDICTIKLPSAPVSAEAEGSEA